MGAAGFTLYRFVADRVTPGEQPDGTFLVTTDQRLTPFGLVQRIEGARPKDLALSPDGSVVAVMCTGRVAFFDAEGKPLGEARLRTGALGVIWNQDGSGVWVSGDQGQLTLVRREGDRWAIAGTFKPEQPADQQTVKGGNPQPTGLAAGATPNEMWVALGRRNVVLRYDVSGIGSNGTEQIGQTIAAQASPYAVASDGTGGYAVANRGGRMAGSNEPGADSAGTLVAVDSVTDAASRGSVTLFGPKYPVPIHVETGRQPSGLAYSPNKELLAVADSDGDTVTLIDPRAGKKLATIGLRPPIEPTFGHEPTGVAFSEDGRTLFVSCGGINAVAVLQNESNVWKLVGHIPTAWYPIALRQREGKLYIACSKGFGNRLKGKTTKFGVHDNVGAFQVVNLQDALAQLTTLSAQVATNNRWGEEQPARPNQPLAVIPERVGEPSVFRHVVYIIKENHTYDVDFGDIKEGNGDPSICIFGEEVTPNAHALARQFVLLDNVYTSGTNSADGHQWTSTAIANAYTEQNYSANTRSYPYDGGDPLAFSPNGFLWTAATANRIPVRVYGEFVDRPVVRDPATGKAPTWTQLWTDYKAGGSKYDIRAVTSQAALRKVLHPNYIGFPSIVSDQWRADQFLKDFRSWVNGGEMPALSILLLPNNHTNGTSAGMPTPRAMTADNDLALGRIVEAISNSKFWKDTLILVIEDDSQLGPDHVDGHRTVAQVISSYTRRRAVVSDFFNHTSFIRTMGLVLGFPALTRFDRVATPLRPCFQEKANLTPFKAIPNKVPLDEMNPPAKSLTGEARRLAELSSKMDWDDVDVADADVVARAAWQSVRPKERFPSEKFHPNRDDH